MKQPNFLIVGAPKCGTTALHHYLAEHPNVFVPQLKEPHFFASDLRASNYLRSEQAYLDLFRQAQDHHLAIGEASVCYLYSRVAAERIRQALPQAKVIAMFRHPVDMFVSLHNQAIASLFEDEEDPEKAWRLQQDRRRGQCIPQICEEPRFLQYGDFCRLGEQLARLLDVFPKEQVHCIVFDDLQSDSAAVYRRALDFLGLPDDGRKHFPRINEAHQLRSRWLQLLHKRVDAKIRSWPVLPGQRWVLRSLHPLSRAVRRGNARSADKRALRPSFRHELVEHFAPDIERLGRLLGRDLSAWLH